ncbi:MAG: hypothetical protein AAFQ62_15780 [Pseudomonadota bacterium]
MQRWLIATAGMIVATLLAERALGLAAYFAMFNVDYTQDVERALAVAERVENARFFSVRLIGFLVCGYLLERRVWLPGLIIFMGFIAWESVSAFQHFAESGTDLTVSGWLDMRILSWTIGLAGALLGLGLGQFAVRRMGKTNEYSK